jgi:hypothetical protein
MDTVPYIEARVIYRSLESTSMLMANIAETLHYFCDSVSGPLGTLRNRLHGFLEVVYRSPDLLSFPLDMRQKRCW